MKLLSGVDVIFTNNVNVHMRDIAIPDTHYTVLLIGAFAGKADFMHRVLHGSQFAALRAQDVQETRKIIEDNGDISCALIDHEMGVAGYFETLELLKSKTPHCQTIVISKNPKVYDALEATRRGAYWFLSEPYEIDQLIFLITKACVVFELSSANSALQVAVSPPQLPTKYLGSSPKVKELLSKVERIAPLDSTVLITGESGTGKTLLARLIHQKGDRKDKRFISLSCAAIPRDLLEAELFGHERGAFTGAVTRPGSIELADGGTLFLDEIGDLPLELQPKLLTFLQDHTVKRLGSTKSRVVNVRIIAATNRDLETMVKQREFRDDLLFRINVLSLHLYPLREHKEDIPEIAEHILARIAEKRGINRFILSKAAINALGNYRWPGNVRELENVLERATAFCDGHKIEADDLQLTALSSPEGRVQGEALAQFNDMTLEAIERAIVAKRVEQHGGNKAEAARSLGISLKTIYNKLS